MSGFDIEIIKKKISEIAKKYEFLLVMLYGSHAKGMAKKESDVDIAVLGKKQFSFDQLIDLNNEFAEIFETNEIDVKSLHNTDPLFRYQVMRDGILIYGSSRDYNSFKAYAFRDYYDSQDIFKLKELIIKKRLQGVNI
ncbi:MAG: nucleotidyltransferase domain-containing protein [Candidatus Paceibacterota bacterium]